MQKYIDCEAFIQMVKDIPMWGSVAAMMADSMPAADVAPVIHGEWVEHECFRCNSDGEPVVKTGDILVCSECGRDVYFPEPYCHCGAKMM